MKFSARLAPARRAHQAVAEDVLLGDDREPVAHEAVLEAEHDEGHGIARQRADLAPARKCYGIAHAMLVQKGLQPVARARTVAGHHHAAAAALLGRDVLAHRVEKVDLGVRARIGEVSAGLTAGIDRAGSRRGLEGREARRSPAWRALHRGPRGRGYSVSGGTGI